MTPFHVPARYGPFVEAMLEKLRAMVQRGDVPGFMIDDAARGQVCVGCIYVHGGQGEQATGAGQAEGGAGEGTHAA